MDLTALIRLRNRLRGAWMWPTFIAAIVADALIGHAYPALYNNESVFAAGLFGAIDSLILIAVTVPASGWLLRRLRPDLPKVVARDYTGTATVLAVTLVLLIAGLANRGNVTAANRDFHAAEARAISYIHAHAPPQWADQRRTAEIFGVQAPQVYRVCVHDLLRVWYCVIVNGRSVKYAGAESPGHFADGL
jgi:hypothetical protein